MNTSMVARFGWIMPLPLAMPPIRQVFPPRVNSTAISFFTVSVVMMPSAASSLPSGFRAAVRAGIPSAMGVMSRGCPMTPVDATATSEGSIERAFARRTQVSSATASPSALQVLALPLLQMTARQVPSAMCRFVTARGAPFTRFEV